MSEDEHGMTPMPIVPVKVGPSTVDMISELCPLSKLEVIEEGHCVYKYVGLADLFSTELCVPMEFECLYYVEGVMALWENTEERTCIFWHDNVLVVMISSTEDQHEGVMNHYGNAGRQLMVLGGVV